MTRIVFPLAVLCLCLASWCAAEPSVWYAQYARDCSSKTLKDSALSAGVDLSSPVASGSIDRAAQAKESADHLSASSAASSSALAAAGPYLAAARDEVVRTTKAQERAATAAKETEKAAESVTDDRRQRSSELVAVAVNASRMAAAQLTAVDQALDRVAVWLAEASRADKYISDLKAKALGQQAAIASSGTNDEEKKKHACAATRAAVVAGDMLADVRDSVRRALRGRVAATAAADRAERLADTAEDMARRAKDPTADTAPVEDDAPHDDTPPNGTVPHAGSDGAAVGCAVSALLVVAAAVAGVSV